MIILVNTWSDVELSSLVDNALMEFQLNETLCWYVFIQPLLLTSSVIATGFVDPHQHTSTNACSRSPVTQIYQLYQCKLLRLGALLHIQAASRGGLSPPLGITNFLHSLEGGVLAVLAFHPTIKITWIQWWQVAIVLCSRWQDINMVFLGMMDHIHGST